MLKLSRDRNGNKTLVYSIPGSRGFSVQTNGNLPKTHLMDDINEHIAMNELNAYIKLYGTKRQKDLFGWY